MGAGHRRAGRPDRDRGAAAGPFVPVLRDGHVRGAAARRAPGCRVLRSRAERGRRRADGLRERAAGAGRPRDRHAAGPQASAGWVDKASARLSARLGAAGFEEAMLAALASEKVLAADETPVSVLDRAVLAAPAADEAADPDEGKPAPAGSPHVMIVRTPDERLTFLQAIASRRKDAIAGALPGPFTGTLITDGYPGYQHLLSRLAGIEQCCSARDTPVPGRHGTRTRRRPGLGRERHHDPARRSPGRRGSPAPAATPPWTRRHSTACANATTPPSPRESSTTGCGTGTTGTTPATPSAPGCANTRNRSSPFTRIFAVSWTNNVSGTRSESRETPSGSLRLLAHPGAPSPAGAGSAATWTRPPPTASPHIDAIRAAIEGKPWLPPLPAIA